MNNILEPIFQILTKEEMPYAILIHFMKALHEISGKNIISQGLEPPNSSDTSV
jgi:hypothetical protein